MRFSVSKLVGIVEFIPAAHFPSNGDYEHYLAWEPIIVLTIERWRLGEVQGAWNMGTEQNSHKEQTRLIDLDESVGANQCP
jgi:hypothetical protein